MREVLGVYVQLGTFISFLVPQETLMEFEDRSINLDISSTKATFILDGDIFTNIVLKKDNNVEILNDNSAKGICKYKIGNHS